MQAYLAIFKRDAQLQPLSFPMPLFALLVTIVLLLITNAVVTGILLLWGCLFCSTLLVNELKVGHAHQLAFVLPHFKVIQFNYSLALCTVMAIATGILLASNIGEAIFWSVFAMFWISLVFLLVNHRAILLVLSFITSVILFTIILTLIDGTILVKQLVRFVAEIFAPFGEVRLFVAAVILALISIYNLTNSRRRFLNYRQYQVRDLPGNWQAEKPGGKVDQTSLVSLLMPNNFHQWLKREGQKINRWLAFDRDPSSLNQVSFDPAVESQSMMGGIYFLVTMLLMLFGFYHFQFLDKADYLFFLVYALLSITLINLALARQFIALQHTFCRLWLMYPAVSRLSFCHKILMIFVQRYLREVSVALVLLFLAGVMLFDLATLNKVLVPIVLSVFITASLTAMVTLLVTVKWPSSRWNTKIVAVGAYAPYFAILFFDIFKLKQLSVLTSVFVAAVLSFVLLWSARFWQKNGLQ